MRWLGDEPDSDIAPVLKGESASTLAQHLGLFTEPVPGNNGVLSGDLL